MTATPNAYDKGRSIVVNIQRGSLPGGRFSDATKSAAYERGRLIALRALGREDEAKLQSAPAGATTSRYVLPGAEQTGSPAKHPDLTCGSIPVRLISRCGDGLRVVVAFLDESGKMTGRTTEVSLIDVRGAEWAQLRDFVARLPLQGSNSPAPGESPDEAVATRGGQQLVDARARGRAIVDRARGRTGDEN